MSITAANRPSVAHVDDSINKARDQIRDLDLNILRQQRRIDKVILERGCPGAEMAKLHADMIESRAGLERLFDRLINEKRKQNKPRTRA